ncbi:Gremlin 2, DAN BMP antagonist [Dermatophagoides pteronyssinus]|uniref:Gremlin 2, DAN BMP antagonist n=1 Tax=Dermatophagoides pteronyssinus TaxID=6956 RepID=A0ABQ8IVS6_DERPT|nr:Gremlin 2, DAN BMP antagonist [Dermatophagoides pteronyssinus]
MSTMTIIKLINRHRIDRFWYYFFVVIILLISTIIVPVCMNEVNESSSTTSTTTTTVSTIKIKPKNSELLSYKMYDNDDGLIPIFERAPNSNYLQLSRMQRHTQTNRKRNRFNNNDEDDVQPIRHRRRNHNRRRKPSIPANYSRQSFESLRSSIIYSNLGKALPSMLAKHSREGSCKTVPFEQKIQHPGCKSRIVNNNYCFGNCNSFYIPSESNQTLPFQSRCTCSPRRYRWKIIRLRCPLFRHRFSRPSSSLSSSSATIDSIDYDVDGFDTNKISLIAMNTDDDNGGVGGGGDPIETPNMDDIENGQIERPLLHTFQYKKIQIITKCRCQT